MDSTNDEIRQNITDNVLRLIEERGLTQTIVAERTGDTQATISNICRGVHLPNSAILKRIAIALDVSMDRLTDPPAKKLLAK